MTCRAGWLPLPPLDEQHRIVEEIEPRLSACDKLKQTVKAGLAPCLPTGRGVAGKEVRLYRQKSSGKNGAESEGKMPPVTDGLVQSIARRIADEFHPEKIFLFGSRAWGNPEEGSDIDLFIILKQSEDPPHRRAQAVYRCLRGVAVPVDVIVQTHDEVEESRRVVTSLARRVIEEGKLLYG